MSLRTSPRRLRAVPTDPANILVIGNTATAHQAASSLESEGFTTLVASSGREALARVAEASPDLVMVGRGDTVDMTHGEVVRQLRARPGKRPPVVVIGSLDDVEQPTDDDVIDGSDHSGEDYLADDVSVAELVDFLRFKLNRPVASRPRSRPAVSEQRLAEEIDSELQRAQLARRQGMLAAVRVEELPRLRSRLGARAEEVILAAFDELFAEDARILERHAATTGGEFLLLMPETDVAAGLERLARLSRRVAGTVLDIGGEHVRVTPVIGYATFSGAGSSEELRDQAATAVNAAGLHLDLVPVRFSPALVPAPAAPAAARDRLLSFVEWLRSPLQIAFTFALLIGLPFIVYIAVFYAGFDLTKVTYPLVAAALAATAATLWIESFKAVGAVKLPAESTSEYPTATAVVAAYLPNEAATIVDTVTTMLGQDYPGELEVILAYNSPQYLPVEATLAELAANDSRLLLLRVESSTSKAQNVNAALEHVRGEFVGIFDADHHPAQGSFSRAWRWLSNGHDVVQGHCVVRNGDASWISRMVAVEFEAIYAVSHPGRARLHGFGIFGGSNGYWRSDYLRQIRMQGSMLTEDIDSSMRSLLDGGRIVSDPGLLSTELAPTTLPALWNQRMRWAQGWTQTATRHLGAAVTSPLLSARQKVGAAFLLGWTQVMPWVTIQVLPILAFVGWRDHGFGSLDLLVPLFVLLSIFTLTVGGAQTVFAYLLGQEQVTRHRWWFATYVVHSVLWFGEFKNLISRVAQVKEITGERQWRVTPRAATPTSVVVTSPTELTEQRLRAS